MPKPFHKLSLQEFTVLLSRFPFTRKVNTVHLHHTWRPNHSQYRGEASIESMWRYHTSEKRWDDIAQHVTVAPDGTIWTGRNWDARPISAKGHNGNHAASPFMVEIIGDFDEGRDRFEGEQREIVLSLIALVQKRFKLPPESLSFHNQMSSKSCPGTAISYSDVLDEVRKRHALPQEELAGSAARTLQDGPFGEEALEINEILQSISREQESRNMPPDDEPLEEDMQMSDLYELYNAEAFSESGVRTAHQSLQLMPGMLSELRPHVINLNQGMFSSEGLFSTTPGDVDAIFDEHLVRRAEQAKDRGEKLRLVFYAHGGLVSESNALKVAYLHVLWWKKNNVYPIYFVWETGLFETIGQLLSRSRDRLQRAAARDVWDYTTDPIIEATARAMYGPTIWSGMKWSAARSVSAEGVEGGALYAAKKLREFCDQHADEIELHAIGHSAGSIFHAYFIPTALDEGARPFRSVHFLAPAIRTDLFKERLAGRLGNGIDQLTIFTMLKDLELADHCLNVYHKSLLYLIYYALETERSTPILGLEASLREDPSLRKSFGLGTPSTVGEVVWSVSPSSTGRSASTSRSHGGFSSDPATMNSVLRRIIGKGDGDAIVEFSEASREPGAGDWEGQIDWPDEFKFLTTSKSMSGPAPQRPPQNTPAPVNPPPIVFQTNGARRRALCIGINRYPTAPLAGCVADARLWAETLGRLGFEQPTLLLDEQATRAAIIDALSDIVGSSAAGDVIVFQFAGHGTQLPDMNADETGEDTAEQDEVLCPYDFDTGAFVIDDDVADIFARIPDGVNVTCFIDCCHSGTISRFGIGPTAQGRTTGLDERPRFISVTKELVDAHRRFRGRVGRQRSRAPRGPESMREVVFSACLSSEIAWESGGQGEFTLRAAQVLGAGVSGVTHEDFLQSVIHSFGAAPRQHPDLDCAPTARKHPLLAPLTSSVAFGVRSGYDLAAPNSGRAADTAQLLRTIASALDGQG